MTRSERFLNWASPVQSGQWEFVQRAECALVRDICNAAGESLEDVVCWKFVWESYTDQFLAPTFDQDRYEADWYHAHLIQTTPPALDIVATSGAKLTHQVFWSTDFGRVALGTQEKSEVEALVLPLLAATSDSDPEMLGQYLLCLQCAGCDLPADRLATFTAWFDEPFPVWSIDNYHPYVLAGVIFALRGD